MVDKQVFHVEVEGELTEEQLTEVVTRFCETTNAGLDFTDISSELYRVYEFADLTVTIKEPLFLHVNAGGHRILDGFGVSHYIPKGWRHLSWKARHDKPYFVK